MKFLQNVWMRAAISLLGGGIIAELIFMSTGDPMRRRSTSDVGFALVYALIIFVLLTGVKYFFGNGDNLIDD